MVAAMTEVATRARLCLLLSDFAKEVGSPVKESPRLFPLAQSSVLSPVPVPLFSRHPLA
jgi:hypothetical protein